jgi:alkylhydroperoxidase/carboxymuconolactone decarboxylase family protein YurZ
MRKVAPPLAAYTESRLLGEVWKRPGLAPRDRSIVTLAALIARNQIIEMPCLAMFAGDQMAPFAVIVILQEMADAAQC